MNDDVRRWLLSEVAKPSGFTPNTQGTVGLLVELEMEGLVRQSNVHPFWMTTDLGQERLRSLS